MDQLCRLLFHISPTCRAQDEKIFSEGSRRLSVSGRKKKRTFALTLKEKSPSLLWGFSPSLLHSPGVAVGSIRPISDCTAPLGTVGSLLRAQKRKAMNSRSCLSLLPEPAGVLRRISQTQHEKCLLLQHSGALMKRRKFDPALINARHFLTKALQNTARKWILHVGLYMHENWSF